MNDKDEMCLTSKQLEQFAHGYWPIESLHRVEAHLDQCDACRTKLESLPIDENDLLVKLLRSTGNSFATNPSQDAITSANLVHDHVTTKVMPETMSVEEDSLYSTTAFQLSKSSQESGCSNSAGTSIGPYRLDRLLGRGTFGEVWLASRAGALATTMIALKIPIRHPGFLELVRAEAQAWTRASGHPNIVSIFEADILDGQIVIASEFIDGGSLKDLIQSRPISINEAVSFCIGILTGLEYLHGRQILHRDLKPANVMIQAGIAKLTDFGLAKATDDELSAHVLAGTPAYMAPEAFQGQQSVASDLWSVAIILYELLIGETPFQSDRLIDLIHDICNAQPITLTHEIPTSLKEILRVGLIKDPNARFKSAAQMRARLVNSQRGLLEDTDSSSGHSSGTNYLSIAITGSTNANPVETSRQLKKMLSYFQRPSTNWYLGTWGTVDELAAELLASQSQQILLVGYEQEDVSPTMIEIIKRLDLTFVHAGGLIADRSPSDSAHASLPLRDQYFIDYADLIIIVWDGKSHSTKRLLDHVARCEKPHMILYVGT